MAPKVSSVLVMFVALLAGCRPRAFRRPPSVGEPIAPDRVVVIGTARFDPLIVPPRRRGNPMFTQITVGFSFEPNTPFHRTTALPQLRGWTYAPVEGGAFVVEAPREAFYVRSLAVHLQRVYGRTYFAAGQLNREIWDELVVCDDNLRVSPQPEDEHIYVGALTCRHADGVPIGVEVADELEALRPQLPPGLHIARRIATRDTPLTPIDPALRVPRSRGGVRARLRN